MKSWGISSLCTLICLSGFGETAEADELLFEDNFDRYPYFLQWKGDDVWHSLDGSVDIIGDGTPYALVPEGNGRYIDLDGYGNPGSFGVNETFLLSHGNTYLLKFDLAGNQGATPSIPSSETDIVTVTFGQDIRQFEISRDQPFQTFYLSVPGRTQPLGFSFENSADGDKQGALLDNVQLTAVETQQIDSCHSGSWYWEEQSGHGFSIEMGRLPDGQPWAAVYWYTYDAGGWPVFLVGTGHPESNILEVDFVSPVGMAFGDFYPDTVDLPNAGKGRFVFVSNDEAIFDYSPSNFSENMWGHSTVSYMPLEKFFSVEQDLCTDIQ